MDDLTWEQKDAFDDIIESVILSKWKAPKNARGHTVAFGQKGCKGICKRVEDNPPGGKAKYKLHAFCSRCNVWMNKEALNNDRCPCCNHRPRQKNFKQ